MSNSIFNNLLKEQIDIFRTSFSKISEDLFKREKTNQPIHSGEFGQYREAICRRFLEFIVPRKLSIDNGFIINSNNEVSTQCDLIIYDANHTPLIQSKELQRFFPSETVCAVGEVKSILTKSDLKKALIKLSKVKELSEFCDNPVFIYPTNRNNYSPATNHWDQIVTFLICKKFDFDTSNLIIEYDNEINQRHWHNIILSIEDGLILYNEGDNIMTVYPVADMQKHDIAIYRIENGKYDYIKIFANYIFHATTHATILLPQILDYMIYPEND